RAVQNLGSIRLAGEVVTQSFQIAHGMERHNVRTAASVRLGWVSIWTNDCDRANAAFIQRKDVAFILQQNEALASGFECDLATFRVELRNVCLSLIAIKKTETNRGAQDSAHVIVDGLLRNLTGFECRQERIAIHELA